MNIPFSGGDFTTGKFHSHNFRGEILVAENHSIKDVEKTKFFS